MSPNTVFEVLNEWAPYRREVLDDAARRAKICGVAPEEVKAQVPAFVLDVSLEEARKRAAARREKGNWPALFFTKGGAGGLARKQHLDPSAGLVVTDLWEHEDAGHTDGAKRSLNALFPEGQPFDTPKPVKLIQRIVQVATQPDSLVLDFFAGSGTAAEAVMAQNKQDGGSRRFVLVQLDEATQSEEFASIVDVTRERVRRAGRRLVETAEPDSSGDTEGGIDVQTAPADDVDTRPLDVGFRAYRLEDSAIRPWTGDWEDLKDQLRAAADNLDAGRPEEDLLTEMTLRLGLDLTTVVESREMSGRTVYSLGEGAMYLCLAGDVDRAAGQEIATGIIAWRTEQGSAETQVIFRDNAFRDDSAKLNTAEALVQGGFPSMTTV